MLTTGAGWDIAVWSIAALLIAVLGGVLLAAAFRAGRPWGLGPQRLRAAPWGGPACAAVFLILWGPQNFAFVRPGGDRAAQLVFSAAILPAQLAAAVMFLWVATGTWPYRGSAARSRLRWLVTAGFAGWLLAVPITLVVHLIMRSVASRMGEGASGDHPLVVSLLSRPDDVGFWALVTLQAVVVAPLREEFFFRGVLQPWAVRNPLGGEALAAVAALVGFVLVRNLGGVAIALLPTAFVALTWAGLSAAGRSPANARWMNWRSVRVLFPPIAAGSLPAGQVFSGVAGTSLLFGMFHANSWPDPVPLTVLSLGLGWLAFRTQSLVAPVVCHALFNALTMFVLRLTSSAGLWP